MPRAGDLKICVIGAGSMSFMANLVRDLAVTGGLHGATLALMDVDPERLKMGYSLAKRYFEAVKADYRLEATMDRREAIRDADFVINLAFAIGYSNLGAMIEAAERHGYYRGLDATEWNMVNTYPTFTAYKQYVVALGIAEDMLELAPDAWLIQVSNPVFEISTLLYRRTQGKLKIIGYCHGAVGGVELLARRALGLDPRRVEFQVAGFNHVVFLTRFRYNGEDAYHLIDEWVEKRFEEFWRGTVLGPWEETLSRAAVDMYRLYGLYPVGDTARSGTWKYHRDLRTKQYWYGPLGGVDSEIGWAIRLLLNRRAMERLRRLAFDPNVDILRELPPTKSGERIVDIIDSIANRVERRLILNIPNKGALSRVPPDVFVEVPARISGEKITPEQVEPLPSRLYSYVLYPRLERLEWALEAFEAGSRELLVDILMRDPRTRSYEQAREAVEAVLNLPFNEDMRRHYR